MIKKFVEIFGDAKFNLFSNGLVYLIIIQLGKLDFMKKKTFAVDIDGTITENGGGRIHLDALEAIK